MYRIAFLLLFVSLAPQSLTAQYRAVFSGAGGIGSSSTYTLQYTVGEPIPGTVATSTNFQIVTGFYLPNNECEFSPPAIAHTTLATPSPNGQPLTIEANVVDPGSGLDTVTLSYRKGGDLTFVETAMNLVSGDTYSATIPGENISDKGGEYFFRAVDNCGNTVIRPNVQSTQSYFPILVAVEAPGLQANLRQGQLQSDYRLISVPLNLNMKSSSSVLAELGSYDDTRWRFWSARRRCRRRRQHHSRRAQACPFSDPTAWR